MATSSGSPNARLKKAAKQIEGLGKEAKGQACLVRLPGICNRNSETTVPAHYPLAGYSGKGIKSPDILTAYACSACHVVLDGHVQIEDMSRAHIRLWHAEGVMRTILKRLEDV